jgi:hypothetical protein
MITTRQRLVVLISVGGRNSRASISSIMRGTDTVVGAGSKSSGSGHFGIANRTVLATALPETYSASPSVVVGWARAKSLLLAVVTSKSKLDKCRDQEENTTFVSGEAAKSGMCYLRSGDGNCKTSSVHTACGAQGDSVGDLVLVVPPEAFFGV